MKKLTNKKGFTLMEMIIVVAIVAILAVITIPTLTGNTGAAKKSADEANLRSAKAAFQVQVLNDEDAFDETKKYYFDSEAGEFVDGEGTAIGQCKNHNTSGTGAKIVLVSGNKVQWEASTQECTEN